MLLVITDLDPSCDVVLGMNWLYQHNPLVDWTTGQIISRPPSVKEALTPNLTPKSAPASTRTSVLSVPSSTSAPETPILSSSAANPNRARTPTPILGLSDPKISFVNAPAFARACRLRGSQTFGMTLSSESARAASASFNVPDKPQEDLLSVPEQYRDFADVFSKKKADTLAPHRPYDLKINLVDGATPPPGTVYSLSQSELRELREFLDEHLRIGFIRPSRSPHGAPVLFVRKKNGNLRLCVDFRGLNKVTHKDRYPLPLTKDLLDVPGKAWIYTKLDLRHAYHLVRIAEGDEWKTAFRTRYGSFEWCVMPFGLTNAPATFQHFMNDIFSDLLDTFMVVYLDDILIYSEDPKQHAEHVREVLRRLRKHGLFLNPAKCEWHAETVEYLGFILSPSGLSMDTAKVQVIQDWPTPRKIKDIQSFLGFANFYRRFVHGYSDIVAPMTRLTRKNIGWLWSDDCQSAFDSLKSAFTSAPILSHYIPGAPLIVETDASDYAVAAILSTVASDGEVHPIAFHSRMLGTSELNYDTHDKELLAIFEAFTTWRHYLEGSETPVDVVTDHKNLEYFSTVRLLSRRQARWSEFLSQFNLIIRFRPGRLGTKPDALTRRWDVYPKEGDSDYARVNPQNLRPVFSSEQLRSSLRASTLYEPALRASFVIDDHQLREDIRSGIPLDPVIAPILEKLRSNSAEDKWSLDDDGLLRERGKIYVPDVSDLRLRVLRARHDHPLAGHFGRAKTTALVFRDYTWPKFRGFISDFCKSCTTCGRAKAPRHKPYGTLKQLPIPEKPWNSISMDFIEQLPDSSGFTAILVVVDRFTKQGIFIPTTNEVDSAELARLFVLHVFSKHGVPSHVTSDRGSEFVSRFFRSLGKVLDMTLHFTSGYHPEGDGQTERTNQTLEQYLRCYCNYQQDNWSELLPLAEFAYNNAPSSTTGVSPFFANKGYHPNITVHPEREVSLARARELAVNLDELHQELRNEIAEAQRRYQGPADKRRTPAPEFKLGNLVYVKAKYFRTTRPSRKLSEKFLGPFPIISKPGSHSFMLRLPDAMRAVHPVFHVSMLELATPNNIPNRVIPPPPPVLIDGSLEHEISEVLDSKIDKRRTCKLLYLVRWAGYEGTDEETSWLLATELDHASEVVSDFHSAYPNKPGPLSHLTS